MINQKETSNVIMELSKALFNEHGYETELIKESRTFLQKNSLDFHNWEFPPEFTKEEKQFVIVYIKNNWGRGESLHEACKNCPSFDGRTEAVIISVVVPAGTPYNPEEVDDIAHKVFVDQIGSIHYPSGSTFHILNEGDKTVKIHGYKG